MVAASSLTLMTTVLCYCWQLGGGGHVVRAGGAGLVVVIISDMDDGHVIDAVE